MKRRLVLGIAIAFVGMGLGSCSGANQSGSQDMAKAESGTSQVPQMATPINAEVFRTPTCGCCGLWIDHAQENGFVVSDRQQEDLTPLKEQYGIPPELASCHTTVANGYVFEGHIPAAEVKRFLADPPADVIGLTVPGMPIGSPGMEVGDRLQPYEVLALHKDGSTSVFATYQ